MDIQKEREAFESWWEAFHNGRQIACDYVEEDNSYSVGYANAQWVAWQAAKAQAVPEGFVLMPKEPTDEIIEAMNEFDYRNDYSDMDGAYRTIVETLEKAQEDAEREQKG